MSSRVAQVFGQRDRNCTLLIPIKGYPGHFYNTETGGKVVIGEYREMSMAEWRDKYETNETPHYFCEKHNIDWIVECPRCRLERIERGF